jgi:glycosyltransferase involved in cell wall biosynthesis/SAM-dependent methyltransferase
MRLAYFSPLPPTPSGIADYSDALTEALRPLAETTVFTEAPAAFDASAYDRCVYQIGNNPHHAFAYEMALQHPGVVVLHEANLHHLIAAITIRRGDWDAYLRECEYEGGSRARAHAEIVRRLEAGPDYEGVRMLRRLLESAEGVIVHSRYMEAEVRSAGYAGPVAVIPHGAWVVEADRNAYRRKLGLDEAAPLAGIFGFLKPYKRIAESLRAFRRLIRVMPNARMILAGEPHPDFPIEPLIVSMGLSANVRLLGFTKTEDFTGYMAACDVVINLRYPTVGESSGTLLRALGLGKAALVSDVGAFRELPDICVKIPVGPGEEDAILEYLNLLLARPDVASALGANARKFVDRECRWETVAARYIEFLSMKEIRQEQCGTVERSAAAAAAEAGHSFRTSPGASEAGDPVEPPTDLPYLLSWAADKESARYIETHQSRLLKTLEMIPPGGPGDRILEMGAYLQITPALRSRLGYGEVRGCYYGEAGLTDRKTARRPSGEEFACEVDRFDAERDRFPYPDSHFSTVVCGELIEHLPADPMHMMSELNRVLKTGGNLVLTTPNLASLRAISAILQGYHPGFYPAYLRPSDEQTEARHNREYTPREIELLLKDSGFEVVRLETAEFRDLPHPEYGWVEHLLERYRLETGLRGDGIYALARKTGPVKSRYPAWLYS